MIYNYAENDLFDDFNNKYGCPASLWYCYMPGRFLPQLLAM